MSIIFLDTKMWSDVEISFIHASYFSQFLSRKEDLGKIYLGKKYKKLVVFSSR